MTRMPRIYKYLEFICSLPSFLFCEWDYFSKFVRRIISDPAKHWKLFPVSNHFSRLVEGRSRTIIFSEIGSQICTRNISVWDHLRKMGKKRKIWLYHQCMSRTYICLIFYLNICQKQKIANSFQAKICTTNAAALCMYDASAPIRIEKKLHCHCHDSNCHHHLHHNHITIILNPTHCRRIQAKTPISDCCPVGSALQKLCINIYA